jgi:hypothetical protein
MTVTNNNKPQVDIPVWEACNFFPAANSALSEMCFIETPNTRYMYMLVGSLFWRYDTFTDTWLSLTAPTVAPLVILSLKYFPSGRYIGQCISGTSTTVTGAFLQGNKFVGDKIRIIAGTGVGQERTVVSNSEATIADKGVPTTATASAITDTLKKWEINQWSGYTCKIVNGAGITQRRKILYNSATVLTFTDNNWQSLSPQENMPFATAPTTASTYTIESNVITVDTPWTTPPDGTSKYGILSGVIGLVSTVATAPFQSHQSYDIAHDIWITRSCQQGHLLAAGAATNDISFIKLDEKEGMDYVTSTATVTGSSTRALGDTTKTWTTDQYANYELVITGGTGIGTKRRILGNTASVLYVDGAMTQPDATSTYSIRSWNSCHFESGWALASILGYDSDSDNWTQSYKSDAGIANIMSIRHNGGPIMACTATRAVTGISAIVATPTNGGTGYTVGDVLTCNQTGSGGLLVVTSTRDNGIVTGLKLQKSGTGYAVASGRTTTGGTGTSCTFEITAVSTIGTITTANNHNFQAGDSITFNGASDAAWNTTYTILGVSGLTTLDVITTAAGNATAATAQSTSVIVDASKNWTINEHAGKIVTISTLGTAGTSQTRRITSNTATALTIYGTALSGNATEGRDRYIIYDNNAFGRAEQEETPSRGCSGYAEAGASSATVLSDTTKAWKGNQWLGYKVRIISGTGFDKNGTAGGFIITSNTPTQLAVSGGYGFTPDATTKYIIETTWGIPTTVTNTTNAVITDTTKNWPVNLWAGFKVRITANEGTAQEATITSNTATALTITGVFTTAPVANSSMYTILGVPARGTGHELTWVANSTQNPGRYFYSPRGGATNIIDRFDITRNVWDAAWCAGPDTETYTVGTMYAYDGKDRIYIQKDATSKLFYIDLTTFTTHGAGFVPYILGSGGIGTAVNGNRMEIAVTADGLKYLYVMKHTGAALSATGGGTEFYKTLIFF